MGITQLSLNRINRHINSGNRMLIVGCQNIYSSDNYMDIAHEYFINKGFEVRTIDILGCQGSEIADLRTDLHLSNKYDAILQHGTIEHVDGSLYQPIKNLHEACAINGIMIHENPKINNWPMHGYHFFTKDFWTFLAMVCNYTLLEVDEEPAMGNNIDGWNICAVLQKANDSEFIGEDKFNEIYNKYIKSK